MWEKWKNPIRIEVFWCGQFNVHVHAFLWPEKTGSNVYMKPTTPWIPEILMECYCVARKQPIRCEITKLQTAMVISLCFWGLLTSWTLLWLVTRWSTFLKFFSCLWFSEFDRINFLCLGYHWGLYMITNDNKYKTLLWTQNYYELCAQSQNNKMIDTYWMLGSLLYLVIHFLTWACTQRESIQY